MWNDWRIGDCPDNMIGARVQIISLENCEETTPANVSSCLDTPLDSSSITLTLSSTNLTFGDSIKISGSISPLYPGKQVILYLSSTDYYWSELKTLTTDGNGRYSYDWTPSLRGTCYIRASYSGDEKHSVADSDKLSIQISLQQNAMKDILTIGFTLVTILTVLFGLTSLEIIKTIV